MPRPKTKTELLELSQTNFDRLNYFIDNLSEAQRNAEFPAGTLNRNISDVLTHLHHWHLLLLQWYQTGMAGEKPAMPAEGYTWKTLPDFNKMIHAKYVGTPLNKARSMFGDSYDRVRSLIEKHTNEELFEKKRYPWTGTTSLGAYLISATSSHYDWALKLLKKCTKEIALLQPA